MATLAPSTRFKAFSAAGLPLAGGKLYSYQSGTTTPLATYTDQTGVTPNTNPVILDSNGEASVWLGPYAYKFVLTDPTGAVLQTTDKIYSPNSSLGAADIGADDGAGGSVFTSAQGFIDKAINSVYVTNVAALRGVAPVNARYIKTKGYYTAGDLGAGNYIGTTGNAPGTYVHNGGTVILPTGGDGSAAWLLKWESFVYAEQFGLNGSAGDSAAMQAAVNAIKVTGGDILIATLNPLFTTSINMTGIQTPMSIRSAFKRKAVIGAKCTGQPVFDCTGSQFLEFEGFAISGNATDTPSMAWLFARNSTNGSAGRNVLTKMESFGNFTEAVIYNYASEELKCYDCYFVNNEDGAACVTITRGNVSGITSPYATIATGSQSTTEYNFHNCAFNSYASSGVTRCVRLNGVSAISFTGDTFFVNVSAAGYYVHIEADTYGATNISVQNAMLDGTNVTQKGLYVTGTNDVSDVVLENILDYGLDKTNGKIIFGADGSIIQRLTAKRLATVTGTRFYSLNYSEVSTPATAMTFAYSCSVNTILCSSASFVFTRPDLSHGNEITFYENGGKYRRSGAASPYAVETPQFVGEEYLQTSTVPVLWKSFGTTVASWGVAATLPITGAGSPIGVVAPRYTGDDYRDTSANAWYKSYGTTSSAWSKLSP